MLQMRRRDGAAAGDAARKAKVGLMKLNSVSAARHVRRRFYICLDVGMIYSRGRGRRGEGSDATVSSSSSGRIERMSGRSGRTVGHRVWQCGSPFQSELKFMEVVQPILPFPLPSARARGVPTGDFKNSKIPSLTRVARIKLYARALPSSYVVT